MGHLNLAASKQRHPTRQYNLLVFMPLGDSLAASGRLSLLRSNSGGGDPTHRHRLIALLEDGNSRQMIEACPIDAVDHMPCEDPRRNNQLSREMNFYRKTMSRN